MDHSTDMEINNNNCCNNNLTSNHSVPDSRARGTNIGSIWGRQDPGGPHVGPLNLAILGKFRDNSPVSHGFVHNTAQSKYNIEHISKTQKTSPYGRLPIVIVLEQIVLCIFVVNLVFLGTVVTIVNCWCILEGS